MTANSSLNPIEVFRTYPINLFKRSRWFYPVYDGTWLLFLGAAIGALQLFGYRGVVPTFAQFRLEYLLAFPALLYVLILGNVFAHNVAHRNLPAPINRLVGEIAGVLVLTRYASWEVIHLRHHRYSDQPGMDPHDCKPGFWNFFGYFLLNVERQLEQNFYEIHGGATPANRRFNTFRWALSVGTGLVLIYFFYAVLGPPLFLFLFVPAQIVTIIHLAHFNWSTHNGFSKDNDYHPINIDRGLYWLGNRIFFGIYYHDNHHQIVARFNPMNCEAELKERAARREQRALSRDEALADSGLSPESLGA